MWAVLDVIGVADHVEAYLARPSGVPVAGLLRELAGAAEADKKVELAFGGLHLDDIDVEEANMIAFETLALGLIALDAWQAGDAAPLEATMQSVAQSTCCNV